MRCMALEGYFETVVMMVEFFLLVRNRPERKITEIKVFWRRPSIQRAQITFVGDAVRFYRPDSKFGWDRPFFVLLEFVLEFRNGLLGLLQLVLKFIDLLRFGLQLRSKLFHESLGRLCLGKRLGT